MRKFYHRFSAFLLAALFLFALVPLPVRADPVTASIMANAMAQAIAGYGASQGVSMVWDVTDTTQIGEGMHDLWEDYRQANAGQDIPTYDSAAITFWANAYRKIGDKLGITLDSSQVSLLDGFWNWVLSGPAEMQKVDNQYYEFTRDSSNAWQPVNVLAASPVVELNGVPVSDVPAWLGIKSSDGYFYYVSQFLSSSSPVSVIGVYSSQTIMTLLIYDTPGTVITYKSGGTTSSATLTSTLNGYTAKIGKYYFKRWSSMGFDMATTSVYPGSMPSYYTTRNISSNSSVPISGLVSDIFGIVDDSTSVSSNPALAISVEPYITNADGQVAIPDNTDVNYAPLPMDIPFDIPWDNSKYGYGTDTMTDAQKKAAEEALSGEIERDGSVTLEDDETQNPPVDDTVSNNPLEYTVPGLADVFPFCIPFDIYNFLRALSATPQAPHFTAILAFPENLGGNQTIDLDFDTPVFNQLAQLLRILELLAFIVGLALLTRSMFIRG